MSLSSQGLAISLWLPDPDWPPAKEQARPRLGALVAAWQPHLLAEDLLAL